MSGCLLALIAACQAGHESHAEALLVWLVPEAARARAGAEALKLAQALRRAGRRLHARRRTRPPAGGPAPQRKLALAR